MTAQQFGIEAASTAHGTPDQAPAKYLVLIQSSSEGGRVARLFLDSRQQVAEFPAAGPEVRSMTAGLQPQHGADAAVWDQALMAHSSAERAAAEVFCLSV